MQIMHLILMPLALLAACAGTVPSQQTDDVRITLQRTVCFGFCPDYTVTINGDGAVTYNGGRFVRVSGEQHGTASRADVAHLVQMFERSHFFELESRYAAHITDLPTYRVTFEQGGRTKSVEDYAGEQVGMPHAVREIEDEIDRVAHTEQWVRRDNPQAPAPRP